MSVYTNNSGRFTSISSFFTDAVRRMVAVGAAGALVLSLSACGTGATEAQAAQASSANGSAESAQVDSLGETSETGEADAADAGGESSYYEVAASFSVDTSDLFSNRDLDASYDEASATKIELSDAGTKASGEGVTVDGSTVTITVEGTYVLSGSLSDGRVVVDADESAKVQLVLDGASVTSSTGTALYVRSADKVFLTLADGSTNAIAATGEATEEDDHALDGAVFAADDLTINGAGSLSVASAQGSGIVAKDELTLVSGTVKVEAAAHAIEAKDSLAVRDGSYTLVAGGDGIHVAHDTNGEKGFVYIAGGTFDITATDDGIHATNDVVIDGGTLTVAADDDGIHSEYDLVINDGTIDVTQSYEGLEGARVEMNGGDVRVVASDDGVNAAGEPSENDASANGGESGGFGGPRGNATGEGAASAGDAANTDATADEGQTPEGGMRGQAPEDGMQGQAPEDGQAPTDGQMPQGGGRGMGRGPRGGMGMTDGQAPEGMEMPEGGQMPQDGQMPEGGMGSMGAGPMGGMGGGMMDADDTATLTISGGKLVVEAGGDGLDSNGALVVSGGETYVSGPTNDGNGSIDYGTSATVTGGVLVAAGSTGMAETFGSDSSQGSALVSAAGNAGDAIELVDESGTVLASFTAAKQYSCVLVTAPGMVEGGTYTLRYGSQTTSFTLSSIAYRDVQGGMGAGGGMRG